MDEILSRPDRYETDNEILARRQKQIDYGKNTDGYKTYMNQIPRFVTESGGAFVIIRKVCNNPENDSFVIPGIGILFNADS